MKQNKWHALFIVVFIIVLNMNDCFAYIPHSELSLGGVYFQMPYEEFETLYPSDIKYYYGEVMIDQPSKYYEFNKSESSVFSMNYPDKNNYTFRINFTYGMWFNADVITGFYRLNDSLLPDRAIYVKSVYTKANNGITTPSGIHVGMTVQELLERYGNPDAIWDRKKYGKELSYFGDEKNGICLTFVLDAESNTKIISISLHDYYAGTSEAHRKPFVIKSLND